MRNQSGRDNERGVVILAFFFVLVVGLIAVAFFYVKHAQDKKSVSTTAAEAVSASGSAITRTAENVQRKNDASLILSATTEYSSANSGHMPVSFSKGMLQGLGHYAGARVVGGDQDPIITDDLRLVTGAACGSGGRAVATSSSHSFVAQFSLQNADGTFTPQCLAG